MLQNKEVVNVVPDGVRPELLDRTGDHGAAPDDGLGYVLQHEVHRHDVDARGGGGGDHAHSVALNGLVETEGLGDGGTGTQPC